MNRVHFDPVDRVGAFPNRGLMTAGAFKDAVFDDSPTIRKLVDKVFLDIDLPDDLSDDSIIVVEFGDVYADERSIPEHGWSIFVEAEEGLIAVFHDGKPIAGLFVTTRGEEYKAGAFILEDIGGTSMFATNADDEPEPHNVWVEEGACSKMLPTIALDFLFGISLKVG